MTIGIKFPFTIGGGNVVTTSSDAEIIQSNIMFCLSTQIGERTMRPTWGLNTMNSLYWLGAGVESYIKEAVVDAFLLWFPDYQVKSVTVEKSTMDPTKVTLHIRYGTIGGAEQTTTVVSPLPAGSEVQTDEGF